MAFRNLPRQSWIRQYVGALDNIARVNTELQGLLVFAHMDRHAYYIHYWCVQASPFVCKAGQNDDNYATVVQLKNIAVTDKRVATGSVNWAYPKGIPKDATYEVMHAFACMSTIRL